MIEDFQILIIYVDIGILEMNQILAGGGFILLSEIDQSRQHLVCEQTGLFSTLMTRAL